MSEEGKEEKKPQDKIELTQEEIESIQNDIDKALNKVKEKKTEDIDKIKAEAKEEAEKELQLREALKAKEKELEEEKKSAELANQNTQAELQAIKEKMNEMISSKQVLEAKNPFEGDKTSVDKMTDEEIRAIEQDSERAFFEQRSKGTQN